MPASLPNRLVFFSREMDETGGDSGRTFPTDAKQCERDEANLIGSLCDDGSHMPVLDFDIPARLVPSTTEGHFHLYIDVPMAWDKFRALLEAMRDCGIIEAGFANASINREASMCRPEWVKKTKPAEPIAARKESDDECPY